jgi:hypothetical protein
MATYAELAAIAGGRTLNDKLSVAVAIQAEVVRNESTGVTNHVNRLIWAKQAFSDPKGMADKMLFAILAQNSAATQAQILAATDASLLTAVAAAVDVFATGS